MIKKQFLLLSFLGLNVFSLFGQENSEKYSYEIHKSADKIKLDGNLDEISWKNAQVISSFFLNRPFDTAFAQKQTRVMMTFDDNFLYIGAICYQEKKTYRVASLKRDFEGGSTDVFTANIDTYKDRLNAFHFAISPLNVQREGLIDNGENISMFWDNKWYSQVTNFDDYWVAELAIPFSTLRYKVTEGQNEWRINFGRLVLETNEISTWAPVPRNFHPANTAFNAPLIWKDNPPYPGKNISVIPYLSGNTSIDFPLNTADLTPLEKKSESKIGIGGDAKIAVTSSLNLDLTFNPDFSQVEVDRQVANLSRFELFFPERRQFFLENNDLFDKWGFPSTRPFFSRRVGIAYNPISGQNTQVPILAGARLSGKLNNKTRIGVIDMQTKKLNFDKNNILPAANYGMLAVQRTIQKRSVLGAVMVNKQNFIDDRDSTQVNNYTKYNRVAGLEYNFNSADGKWEGESYYHHSFSPNANDATWANFLGYNTPTFSARAGYMQVGKNYRADVGFVPRTAYRNIYSGLGFSHFTSDNHLKAVNSVGLFYDGNYTLNWNGKVTDVDIAVGPNIKFDDTSEGFINFSYNYTYLFYEFDPTNAFLSANPDLKKNIVSLPIGNYSYPQLKIGYYSSQRNNLNYSFNFVTGKYFNGKGTAIETDMGFRFQPYGKVSATCNYYNIRLPLPYNSTKYWLVGPRAELSFTRTIFFSAFYQYNTQTNNMNLNARFQWRFRPVSDLFIVYTDNYFAQNIPQYNISAFNVKNRALVVKLTFWLNV